MDVGDIIACTGEVFRTGAGQLSVRELTLVSKSLLPLPEKFHGLTDREARYRQRYVDLIVNPEVKDTFCQAQPDPERDPRLPDEKRLWRLIPILTPFEIGASARPFLYPSQYAGYGYGAAHRDGALPQAPDRVSDQRRG